MHVLLIKTSSMGDVIHTLPALTDAGKAFPGIQFDWVIEDSFENIPYWHPLVKKVIPVALRRWRKNLFSKQTRAEWLACREQLHSQSYDVVLDAQGLLKSAWIARFAKGKRCGLDWHSAREPLSSLFYQKKIAAGKIKETHAVTRMRNLFSRALNYALEEDRNYFPDYGLNQQLFNKKNAEDYLVFLHGTTWPSKHWPESYWITLTKKASQYWRIKIPWGNEVEYARAKRMQANLPNVDVLPRLSLTELAGILSGAKAVVAVDTGLGHVAAALDVPTISLYGPTQPALTGALGRAQIHLSATQPALSCPLLNCTCGGGCCFSTLPPETVWDTLFNMVSFNDS